VNVQDKVAGIRTDAVTSLYSDVMWKVLFKVIRSNARFGLSDHLEVHLYHGRFVKRQKGGP